MNSKFPTLPALPKTSQKKTDLHKNSPDLPMLNTAIVGGGKACFEILKQYQEGQLDQIHMKIIGISSLDPHSEGFLYAKEMGIFTTTDYKDLFHMDGLNLIIELTGSDDFSEHLLQTKPGNVALLDHKTARLLWTAEAHLREEEMARQRTQTILDSLPYRLMVVNEDMTISMVNKTFLKENNLTYEEALKRKCYKVRYKRQWPCYEMGERCYLNEVKKTGQTVSTILETKTEDGKTRFDTITVAPIFDEAGKYRPGA